MKSAGRVPTAGFWGTWLFLFKNYSCLLAVFACCVAVILHIVLASIPDWEKIESKDFLGHVLSSSTFKSKTSPVVTLAGLTIYDKNDWLHPAVLGLREVDRAHTGPPVFDSKLWSEKLLGRSALPTHPWWQAWIIPPGTGSDHGINQHPYRLEVITKEEQPGQAQDGIAGLQILAPYTKLINAADGSVFGIGQSLGPAQIGLIAGVSLPDGGDYVKSHYIETYGTLHLVKRWDIKLYNILNVNTIQPLRAYISRGSPYITFSLPQSLSFSLESMPQDSSKDQRNAILFITDLGATTLQQQSTCASLTDDSSLTADAIELKLADKTSWIAIFDHKVNVTCNAAAKGDRLTIKPLGHRQWLARVAISDITSHDAIASGLMPLTSNLQPKVGAPVKSKARWKLLASIKKLFGGSVSSFVDAINSESLEAREGLEKYFVSFPLKDKLTSVAETLNFTLTTNRWNENEVLNAFDGGVEVLVLPDRFIEDPSAFFVSENFKARFLQDFISRRGRTLLAIGGAKFGATTTFIKTVLGIDAPYYSTWDPVNDPPIIQSSELNNTLPFMSNDVPLEYLPDNMPDSLPEPPKDTTTDLLSTGSPCWPCKAYCRSSALGSACDGVVDGYFFVGAGGCHWLGNDMKTSAEMPSEWTQLLERALVGAGCTAGMQTYTNVSSYCNPIKKVLLLMDVDAIEQESIVDVLMSEITVQVQIGDDDVVRSVNQIDFNKTIDFLKGTYSEVTNNIDNPVTRLANPASETYRDWLLRHAFVFPVSSAIDVDFSDELQTALLRYQFEVQAITNARAHTLYPLSSEGGSRELLWPPLRLAVLTTPLHRQLEYEPPFSTVAQGPSISMEDDQTMCLPSVVGLLCARSFGLSPNCRAPDPVPSSSTVSARRVCTFKSNGSLDPASWNPSKADSDLIAGKSAIFQSQHLQKPVELLINLPLSGWDVKVRTDTGSYRSLLSSLSPGWIERLRWAIEEDVDGLWRLEGDVWAKNSAADDVTKWVRSIHRYGQIALAADAVGLRRQRNTAIQWLKKSLSKFYNNSFDNKVLLYDRTWGGLVPCGCDRDKGNGDCYPPPRVGFLNHSNSADSSEWLSLVCPSFQDPFNQGGAGFFANHHTLFGYVIYSTAVVAKFEPFFLSRRVRLRTSSGVHRPKIHHLVLAMIQDFAIPPLTMHVSSKLSPFYPEHRYKDWWRLHSYGSAIKLTSTTTGPSQSSVSESIFGYWAVVLYADVIGDQSLKRWAQLLAGTELMAANTLWHVKEYTDCVPAPMRYLGAIGTVSESALTFQTEYSVSPYEVFHSQVLPLTALSFDLLEPGWALWMYERWKASCQSDFAGCSKAGADVGATLIGLFCDDWGTNGTSADQIAKTVGKINSLGCFQMGSYDCGMHTLTNSILFAALSQNWGGAVQALLRDDGNGRYQVY